MVTPWALTLDFVVSWAANGFRLNRHSTVVNISFDLFIVLGVGLLLFIPNLFRDCLQDNNEKSAYLLSKKRLKPCTLVQLIYNF